MVEENHYSINAITNVFIKSTMNPDDYFKLPSSNSYELNIGYGKIIFTNMRSNCKLWSVENLSSVIDGGSQEEINDRLYRIDKMFNDKIKSLAFTVNVTDMRIIRHLETKFKLVGISQIPIGYRKGNQFHATFLTNYKDYNNYINYFKRCEDQGLQIPFGFPYGKQINIDIKKFNDIFTPEVISKLVSYKRDAWFKRYLITLLTTKKV